MSLTLCSQYHIPLGMCQSWFWIQYRHNHIVGGLWRLCLDPMSLVLCQYLIDTIGLQYLGVQHLCYLIWSYKGGTLVIASKVSMLYLLTSLRISAERSVVSKISSSSLGHSMNRKSPTLKGCASNSNFSKPAGVCASEALAGVASCLNSTIHISKI